MKAGWHWRRGWRRSTSNNIMIGALLGIITDDLPDLPARMLLLRLYRVSWLNQLLP